MQYNDTTSKTGMLQEIEFWCNLGDGGVTNSTLLKQYFTNRLNRHYERLLAKANLNSREQQMDDTNYTDHDFATFNIVSGTIDYTFLTDANSNSITDITGVSIIESASGTDYVQLDRLTVDNAEAQLIMSPNSGNTGIPTGYIERNNTIWFNTIPNYSKTAGGKLFFRRVPSYFTTSDTTKKPGFAAEYHILLPLNASYDWVCVNMPENVPLITRLEAKINTLEEEYKAFIAMKNPVRRSLGVATQDNR